MAAPKKVTREMIIEAGLRVLREDGFESINARSIANKAGFSTQPIYKEFANMEELKDILREEARKLHTQMIQDYIVNQNVFEYMAYGLGFVKFAREEKQFFRYLYLDGFMDNRPVEDVNWENIIEAMMKGFGWDRQTCEKFHMDMSLYTYGLAIMAYIGTTVMSDDEIRECLNRQYEALYSIYGKKGEEKND